MSEYKKDAAEGAIQKQLHDNIKQVIVQALIQARDMNKYFGDDKRLTRWQLALRAHTDERTVRDAVQHLREDGEPICITKDGKGYWYGTEDEYEETVIADYLSRMGSMGRVVKAHYDRKQVRGQIEMDLDSAYGDELIMFGVDFSEPLKILDDAIKGLHGGQEK